MHSLKRQARNNSENGISPVVGVMLMLVVTIIVAAVVSGFSGELIGSSQKAPSLSMDVKIVNTGSSIGSGFYATVLGSSEAIPTKDLKLITSWHTSIKDNTTAPQLITGKTSTGGNTSIGNVKNFNAYVGMSTRNTVTAVAPFGEGPGVIGAPQNTYGQNSIDPYGGTGGRAWQWFGNYSIMTGMGIFAQPSPYIDSLNFGGLGGYTNTSGLEGGYGVTTKWKYTSTNNYVWPGTLDAAQAVLGSGWENLRAGDIVNVKIIHVPSGKTIYQKDVTVSEG